MRGERMDLPTKAQIAAIVDASAVDALTEDVAATIESIEAQLQFYSESPDDWRPRAVSALARFRVTKKLLLRRASELRRQTRAHERGEAESSELTRKVLGGWSLDPDGLPTGAACDEAEAEVSSYLSALDVDAADENTLDAGERDLIFLARARNVRAQLGQLRCTIQRRRADLRRAAKLKAGESRERCFVDRAREMLPQETYLAIWAQVDRLMPEAV